MARPKDSAIEQCLRRIVREAKEKNDEEFSVKRARLRAEAELKLEDGFLKNDEVWKQRSRHVIQSAFEEEEEVEQPKQAKPKKPTPQAPEPAAPSNKRMKEKPRPQKSSAKAGKPSKEPPVTNITKSLKKRKGEDKLDDEDESSSEDSEEEGEGSGSHQSQTTKQPALKKAEKTPPKVNGVKRRASGQSPSGEESEQEESEGEDEPQRKKAKTDSATSSEEGSDDESERAASRDVEKPAQASLDPIPSKLFKPPQGYTVLDPALLANTTALSPANLKGKQIWHITAPSNLPLSSITRLSLDAIQSGAPVLTHKGVEYVLKSDASHTATPTVLLPTAAGYENLAPESNIAVERTLQLQQKIILPNLTVRQASQVMGSRAAADVALPSVSSVRPQPKGLRMRYKPPGFGAGRPGMIGSGSDEEREDEQLNARPTFQFPRALGAHGLSTQRESRGGDVEMADVDGDAGRSESQKLEKKKKKKRKDKHDNGPAGSTEPSKINGVSKPIEPAAAPPAAESSYSTVEIPAKTSKEKPVAAPPTSTLPNGTAPAETLQSKEEKARRKEEKRARKEAKRKAKEAAS